MEHTAITSVVLALAIGSGGCSFALPVVPSEPNQRTPKAARTCSLPKDRWLVPVFDTINASIAAINMGVAANAKSYEDLEYGPIKVEKSVGFWGLGVVPLALFGAGAVYGYVQCARCDALLREHRMDLEGKKLAPVETAEQREQRWSNAEDSVREQRWSNAGDSSSEGDARTVLPEWSAFRREPLEPIDTPDTPEEK